MKTKFTIVVILVIIAASIGLQGAIAKGTPYDAGFKHAVDDCKLPPSQQYINQPSTNRSHHSEDFIRGYDAGALTCHHAVADGTAANISPSSSSTAAKKSQEYEDGFAAGVKLADTNFKAVGPESHHVNSADLDCDSDVNPREANQDYCDSANDGYAFEANMLSGK